MTYSKTARPGEARGLTEDIAGQGKAAQQVLVSQRPPIQEAVGVTIEKVLITANPVAYDRIVQMLDERGLDFCTCYEYPAILNVILRQVCGIDHVTIVRQINRELEKLDDQKGIAEFVKVLSL